MRNVQWVKLAVPYTPNLAEYLIMQNRKILADQMEFLTAFARKKGKAAAAPSRRA